MFWTLSGLQLFLLYQPLTANSFKVKETTYVNLLSERERFNLYKIVNDRCHFLSSLTSPTVNSVIGSWNCIMINDPLYMNFKRWHMSLSDWQKLIHVTVYIQYFLLFTKNNAVIHRDICHGHRNWEWPLINHVPTILIIRYRRAFQGLWKHTMQGIAFPTQNLTTRTDHTPSGWMFPFASAFIL